MSFPVVSHFVLPPSLVFQLLFHDFWFSLIAVVSDYDLSMFEVVRLLPAHRLEC